MNPTTTQNLSDARRQLLEKRLRGQAASGAPRANTIPRRTGDGPAPLSLAQQRLWFIDQMDPGNPAYNLTKAVFLNGELDEALLVASFEQLVARHETLRTVFSIAGGEPVQLVQQSAPFELARADLSSLPEDDRERALWDQARAWHDEPFDLETGPLLRAGLARVTPQRHLLVITLHHVISDGWSIGIVLGELSTCYRALCNNETPSLRPLEIQYADYAQWQRGWLAGERFEAQSAYWRERLGGEFVPTELPPDNARPPAPTFSGERAPMLLPTELAVRLRELSREHEATLFMTLLTAFKALLARWTGAEDLAIGSPVAGRQWSEVEPLIGFFINTLVMRTDLSGDPSFAEALARVRRTALEAYANQDLPYDQLVEQIELERDPWRQGLVRIMFQVQNAPAAGGGLPGLRLEAAEFETGTAKFDLTCTFLEVPGNEIGLVGIWEYNRDLYDRATIERLIAAFRCMLDAVAAEPARRLSRLPLMDGDARAQALAAAQGPCNVYPADSSLAEIFEAHAARAPEAPAVRFGTARWSYGELNARANQLAHRLIALGVERGTPVALCLERGAPLVAAMLGVLKAGGAYVPIDPVYPPARINWMLQDSGARVLVCNPESIALTNADNVARLALDASWVGLAGESRANPPARSAAGDPAYIIYTSGSTGTPKGVCLPQRGVARLVCNPEYMIMQPCDRMAQASSCSFDAATIEIWGALLNGACLVGIETPVVLDPRLLGERLREERITTLFLTTSLFNQVAREAPGIFADLRDVMFGGESGDPAAVRAVLRQSPPRRLVNLYGPTEITSVATWQLLRELDERQPGVPIGRPIANTSVYVLDGAGEPLPAGAIGELWLGGPGVALGYLNRPELTAERFLPDPFSGVPGARLYRTGDLARVRHDGAIEFMGRRDGQVKLRGFRIELGEIESVLTQHPAIGQAAVLALNESGTTRLVAYVAPAGAAASAAQDTAPPNALGAALPAAPELRGFLKQRLPDYMIPGAFVAIERLPLMPNGKLDRRALPPPGHAGADDAGTAFIEPRTPMELMLAEAWREVLKVERVGVHDNFFDLGGHSLMTIQVITRIEERVGLRLSPIDFMLQSLGQIAADCEARLGGAAALEAAHAARKEARA